MKVLTQVEADRMLAVRKVARNKERRIYPGLGNKLVVPLQSHDGQEIFMLDITPGRKIRTKVSWQTRTQTGDVLARLDFGVEHSNPDDSVAGSPHLHLYREGERDKWAYSIKPGSTDFCGIAAPALDAGHKVWFDYFLAICNIKNENILKRP